MKGKVSRTLAAKAALCIRFDALGIYKLSFQVNNKMLNLVSLIRHSLRREFINWKRESITEMSRLHKEESHMLRRKN